MGESAEHINLVDACYKYILLKVPKDETCLVLVDKPSSIDKPPRNSNGFRPDVQYYHGDLFIVGDAKTSSDLETTHSKQQIESFIRECDYFDGKALLVLAVPLIDSERACSLISTIQYKINTNINYAIVTELGVFKET
ncbi:MAG: hypothetical protein MJ189_05410 [Coriobacteriales bacterium]|nr:hypothetical protein [Coriobacteriales bacterium]